MILLLVSSSMRRKFVVQHTRPKRISHQQGSTDGWGSAHRRLILGSYLAQYLRLRLEEEKGYTSTVGISTNKLLSKLVGNVNKPKSQTTLLDPYDDGGEVGLVVDGTFPNNVRAFVDGHDIGKIPGIGFKMARRIRNHILSIPLEFDDGRDWTANREPATVHDVRLFPGMGPEILEQVLGGTGAETRDWRQSVGFDEWD